MGLAKRVVRTPRGSGGTRARGLRLNRNARFRARAAGRFLSSIPFNL
jgi:hypothetical protein